MASPMRVRSFTSGKGGKELQQGLKELEAKLKALGAASVTPEVRNIVRDAVRTMYLQVVNSAQSANVPHEALLNIFFDARPNKRSGRNTDVSGLVGLRKRGRSKPYASGYMEWYPSSQKGKYVKTIRSWRTRMSGGKREGRQLVMPGAADARGSEYGKQLIGENLATMWELGTTKMRARPFFRSAVMAARQAVADVLTNGLRKFYNDSLRRATYR